MIKMHIYSCHLCLYRILSPVFLTCVQGEGKDQTKTTEMDLEKLLELLGNEELPGRGD